MIRRGLLIIAALVSVETAVFYVQYRDLVLLNASEANLVADPRFPEMARAAIAREQISRRMLERVADVAHKRQDARLYAEALERIAASAPDDPHVRLRLADALRQAGRLDEAETLYRRALAGHEVSQ